MSPLPVIAAIAIVRVVLASGTAAARAGAHAKSQPIPSGAGRFARWFLVWLIALPVCGWTALAPPRTLATYVPGLVFLATIGLWPLARYVLAPLGLVKPAYYVALGAWATSDDRASSALLAAAIALTRKRDFDPDSAAWVEDKIQAENTLRGGAIAAAAVAALARGDTEGARVLFESVRTLDSRVCPPAARHTAANWLAAEAASRGAWEEIIALGADVVVSGPTAWLLSGVAKRLLGKPDAPGRANLLLRWALAGRRLQTFPIVERALSVPDGGVPEDDDLDTTTDAPRAPEDDPLARALAAHVHLLRTKKPSPAEIARVGRAFDEALDDSSLARHIEDRAAFLGAMRSDGVIARLRADVEESLFQLLKRHRISLDDTADDLGAIASRAQRRLRDETLTVIEALSDAVRSRVRERRPLSAIDEWREWSALRMAYERGVVLGGPELRYLAFTKVHSDVCALAVWLFNERKEKPIANAMFRFLLAEATQIGDSEAIALQAKNVGCGI